MALLHVHFYSGALGMQRTMDVVLPEISAGIGVETNAAAQDVPVLYLLHGWSDDHTIWQRRTSIERYALEKGLAVIMPGTDLGFYTDMKYGYDFWQFFSVELPKIVHEFFPHLSQKRENTFVAGLSMGGFGALKLGINCPEKFAAVASLSGLVNPLWQYTKDPKYETWLNIFGDETELRGSISDIHFQLEKLIKSGKKMPEFYQTCGTEDFLYQINVEFRDAFKDKINLTYHEESGIHEWGYWDRNIQRVIDWLPLEKNKEAN